jgi:hypothetical protein
MSFTKLSYDNCSYKANLEGNVSHLSYTMDPVKFYNCNKCRNEIGMVGGTAVSHVSGNIVDMESNLFGIDREASKCAAMKYVPKDDKAEGTKYYQGGCANKVDTSMQHLQPCQMHSVLGVPHPPKMYPFTCPK